MSDVDLHAPFMGYRGTIGKLVYKKYKGRTIASLKPGPRTTQSEAALAQQETFGKGIAYAKKALAKPAIRAYYETCSKEKDIPIFALMVGDYLNAPSMDELDLSEYKGQVGDPIAITTHDDVGVISVEVTLTTMDGTVIEKGQAVEAKVRSGNWVYIATAPVVQGTDIFIEAEGFDRAGNRTVSSANPTVGM
jgi:hypothetical protein